MATKFAPNIDKVKACSPTGAAIGPRELIVGTELGPLVMVKFTAFEVPAPVAGLVVTVEAATKFVPLTVSVKAAPPAVALFGEIAVTVGAGFCWMLAGGAVPHPVRHNRLTIPRIANPFIRILRVAISLMMPLSLAGN